jgi:mannan endo-1,4-beta-mannosidase
MRLFLFLVLLSLSAMDVAAQCGAAPHCVVLTWTAPTTGGAPASYNAKRSTTTGGPYTTVGSVTAPTVTFTDLSATGNVLAEGTTYFYVVTSANTAGESAPSNETSARIPTTAPTSPTGLGAVAH